MSISKRPVLIGLVLLLAAAAAGLTFLGRGSREPVAIEIGVLFPLTSEQSWNDFREGIWLAAREKGLKVVESLDDYVCLVQQSPRPVRFRWYRVRGSGGIRKCVGELCKKDRPPLALVGANNSSLTLALAVELAKCADRQKVPVLLMTTATAVELIQVNPDRSFRFGYNNSYQARTVVEQLGRYYTERNLGQPEVEVLLVTVQDNPFSVDLAYHFQQQLRKRFAAKFVIPPKEFARTVPKNRAVTASPEGAWVLSTVTGDIKNPNEEEWRLAHEIVRAMIAEPDKQWVLVLPVGTDPYRRVSYALHKSFAEAVDPAKAFELTKNLVVLSGDAMGYYDFRDSNLLPDETPAPVIFFEHVNPLDPTVSESSNPTIPARGLGREVVRTLLTVLSRLGPDPTHAELATALADYVPPDRQTRLFKGRERHEGGGAIVAIPRPETGDFQTLLPEAWEE